MQQKYAVIIDRRHPMAGDTVAIERFTELGAEGSIIQPDLSVQETTLSSDQYEMVTHLLTDFWLKVGDRTHYRLSKMGAIARSKIQEQIKKANNIPNRDATKIKVIGWFSRMKSDRQPAIAQSKELVPHTTKVASITPNTIQSICWGTSVNTTADKDAVSSHRLIPEATKDRSTTTISLFF